MGRAQLEELKKHGVYLSTPRGISMNPMLYQNDSIAEVHAITQPPKRYDVVLYIRGKEQGVVHRVLHFKNGVYIINGDNCWQKEYVQPSQIYGIVTRFYRHGVEIPGARPLVLKCKRKMNEKTLGSGAVNKV